MTRIFEADNHILIHTGYGDPVKHSHMAAQIIVSEEDCLDVECGGKHYCGRGIVIPAGMEHLADTHGKPVLVFLYDASSEVAGKIRDAFVLEPAGCDQIWSSYHHFLEELTAEKYAVVAETLLIRLGLVGACQCKPDERIRAAMGFVRSSCGEMVSRREVASFCHLSESRFSHLFTKQVGMTFASYVIYQRLMHAYADIISGKSITDAALDAGFCSSSHFADVSRRIFGLPAGRIADDLIFRKI